MKKKLTCTERETLFHENGGYTAWQVTSGLHDMFGTYGEPTINVVWEHASLRITDIQWPNPKYYDGMTAQPAYLRPCEHYLETTCDNVEANTNDTESTETTS